MFSFTELVGSSTEEWSSDGLRVRRRFLVAWPKRQEFVHALWGPRSGKDPASSLPEPYPVAIRFMPVTDEPSLSTTPEGPSPAGPFVQAEVDYHLPATTALAPGRQPLPGDVHLVEQKPQLVRLFVSPQGWHWPGPAQLPLPPDVPLAVEIPVCEYLVTIRLPLEPPWDLLGEMRGKVNGRTFLGFPPETVLLVGLEGKPLWAASGPTARHWELRCHLVERCLWQAGQPVGWNHLFRPDTGRWERPLAAGQTLYASADFQLLLDLAGL
ncbi:MAG: hypothetical protein NZ899_06545 [Thermoguttaceae bacterium]|nr:hypothetical protein [Thermoguttaceae bacterium]MDW8079179.1 hypothetical protein [Thermoguttaceae bacterium]